MNEECWPPEWTRAILALNALAVIAAENTTYGYQIAQRLERAGFGKIKGGTLYPILARLEKDGLISSSWGEGAGGPGRKFVSITDGGRLEIAQRRQEWQTFTETVDRLWSIPDTRDSATDGEER
ncbi:MAG: PadR family transcriptional regulator [Chloroflexota bacterium]|nr:PadR family transcriptional regulator [Chloroflexota bacterium]